MAGISAELTRLFNTDTLYGVLNVPKTATTIEIKKAYLKVARDVHPDRNPDDADAKEKFQLLTKVHEILSNADSRAVYDETGSIEEDDSFSNLDADRNWEEYWRLLYQKITTQDIEAFAAKYRDSEEEVQDVCKAYEQRKGNMDLILETVMLATPEDVPRFEQILLSAISEKKIKRIRGTLGGESKSKKVARGNRYKSEAKEAEEMAKQMKVDSEDGLRALILQRQEERRKALDSTNAAKYGGETKKSKAKKSK